MTNRVRIVCGIGILIVCLGGFVYWQISKLKVDLSKMTLQDKEAVFSVMSSVVLAPDLNRNPQQNSQTPLLDQYRRNPAAVHYRSLLVLTWLHASKIAQALASHSVADEAMYSTSVRGVSKEDQVDAWGQPYCIVIESAHVVLLSSGGNGQMDCQAVHGIAHQAGLETKDARLTKYRNLLVTVQSLDAKSPRLLPST